MSASQKKIFWECNLCGVTNSSNAEDLHREAGHCKSCNSSVRQREIMDLLEQGLPQFKRITPTVIGMSDPSPLCDFLQKVPGINYLNTYLTAEPKLDILNLLNSQKNTADILISSDILEHVPFPPKSATDGMYELLKNNGLLILTVPWFGDIAYQEHYPWMVRHDVIRNSDSSHTVYGFDVNNKKIEVLNPIFHGGPGSTLEMRLFTLSKVLDLLQQSGFQEIAVHLDDVLLKGIRRDERRIGAITATKP